MGSSRQTQSGPRLLCAGDNLECLAQIERGAVTLAYLDPPFNSGRLYETVHSRGRIDGESQSSHAFVDHWEWSDYSASLAARLEEWLPTRAATLVRELARSFGQSEMAAYLVSMAPRLGEVHRLLSDTGSLYVHCDPAASHYLKIILDLIFGPENFRNEIIWKRTHAHSSSRRYGPIHDCILFYSKTSRYTWNKVFSEYRQEYLDQYFTHRDDHGRYQLITCTAPGDRSGTRAHYEWKGKYPPPGRHWAWRREQMEFFESEGKLIYSASGTPRLKRYTTDGSGVLAQDIWTDINRLDAHSEERVGYETQKPVELLKRIISASSSPGDTILDPFCGTGTTMVAAELLDRRWIGIDSSLLAACLALSRIRQVANLKNITLLGFPSTARGALRILEHSPASFGLWGTSMLGTLPDRRTTSGRVTTGLGRLRVRGRDVQLLSWVPLESNPDLVTPVFSTGRLAKVGFALRTSNSLRDFRKWLKSNLNIEVHEVAISELVAKDALSRGLVASLPDLAAAAR